MTVVLKRVYDPPKPRDGVRLLVDRLWPRGLSKQRAKIDEWLRDLAPSDALRHWYHARPHQWEAFRKKYLKELTLPQAQDALSLLYQFAHGKKQVTLLFASKNEEQNNATVLKELLDGKRKPPTGTGPGAVHALRKRAIERRR